MFCNSGFLTTKVEWAENVCYMFLRHFSMSKANDTDKDKYGRNTS